MANITISDIRPAGAELFQDSESFINELTDNELNVTHGGVLPILLTIAITTLIAHPAY